jgi:hypothetical protein
LANGAWSPVATTEITPSSNGDLSFIFSLDNPSFQTDWRVDFTDLSTTIQSVVVSGQIVLEKKPSEPQPRASLALYPNFDVQEGSIFCRLAFVDVDNLFRVTDIIDIRDIIHRDYVPVTDWLTLPFDEDLISYYEQVKSYSPLWMAPPNCMKQEYTALTNTGVIVE